MKLRWLLVALLILLVFGLSACSMRTRPQVLSEPASPDALPTLTGSYSVNGFDPQGTEYGGNLSIRPGDVAGQYRLQWIVTGSIQEGVGQVQGNQILVHWKTIQGIGPGASGVTTFTITTKGELTGQRQVDGQQKLGKENAFPNDYD